MQVNHLSYLRLLIQKIKRLPSRRLTLLFSVLTGIICGFAAITIKWLIHFVKLNLTGWLPTDSGSILLFAYPMIGVLLSIIFLRLFVRDDISHGVTKVLYAMSRKESRLKAHNMYTSMLATSLTIGLGGSVGAEGPIVMTGSAIGSNIGQFFRVDARMVMLLLGAGASGAIAGAFGAPLAGVIFTLEVLMLDLTMSAVVPLLLSTVCAVSITYLFVGSSIIFPERYILNFSVYNIPYYIILGIICGAASLYFTWASITIEGFFRRQKSLVSRFLIGGVLLGLLIMLFPSLYGEGYEAIGKLLTLKTDVLFEHTLYYNLNGEVWALLLIPLLIIFFKVPAMACTFGAGGVGGIFAPSLFVGGMVGFFVATSINVLFGMSLPVGNFTLVGMAGVLAGVMHAPLTGVFLIAEITGGYQLFIPLMLVSVLSYITVFSRNRHSLYTLRLAQSGDLITHHKDKAAITTMSLDEVVEADFIPVALNATLGELVKAVAKSKRNIFPVVDWGGCLKGVVLLDDIRHIMFDQSRYDEVLVSDLLILPPDQVVVGSTMEEVFAMFEESGAWNLPVVDSNGVYVGFVSRSRILSIYREKLVDLCND
ncbi:chloride channel protein [uncultured Acetobacteroides sp.]|uniref:chloride channel protein n=1 Tax=uncultured Acetobacteroides sp. TaxID=1760811 RepID=UPI0029F54291|nr:chloride channel protein [uncultured Acetobacteroides sp.]